VENLVKFLNPEWYKTYRSKEYRYETSRIA
jgi:hypothetical protein